MKQLRREVRLGFVASAAVVFAVGGIAVWSSIRSQTAARERRALFERRAVLERHLSAMQDAETGQRGFLLTGDSTFLIPYISVVTTYVNGLSGIREAEEFSGRGVRLDSLGLLTQKKLDEMAFTVGLVAQGRRAAALDHVRSGIGQEYMNDIRRLGGSLVAEENVLLELWDARLRWNDRVAFIASATGASLSLVLLLAGLTTINRRINEREKAEDDLRESRQHLIRLIEALPLAVFVLDAEGKPFYANRASQAILGKALDPDLRAGDLPQTYNAFVAGTDQLYPAERQPIVRALAGELAHTEDLEIHRPERTVPLEIWAAPIYDSKGRVAFAVSVFSDITERNAARAAIRDLNHQLERRVAELVQVNHELEAFSYSVSHDLRAPVRHIDGFSRLLQELIGQEADPQVTHYLDRIKDAAAHMGALIDDLLKLARMSRQELVIQRCDPNAVLRSVVYDLRDEIADRDIEWRIEKLPGCDYDAGLLKHVFTNLLNNALKFSRTRSRSVIEVAPRVVENEPAILVRDNGVGFDMRYADKLFGVFQRLHLPEEFEGTGVGLATVQRIVRKHGGRIWAEAELDKGATFYFTLAPPPSWPNAKGTA